jgi:hypothetical protein
MKDPSAEDGSDDFSIPGKGHTSESPITLALNRKGKCTCDYLASGASDPVWGDLCIELVKAFCFRD